MIALAFGPGKFMICIIQTPAYEKIVSRDLTKQPKNYNTPKSEYVRQIDYFRL
jgi:hypothetical protein